MHQFPCYGNIHARIYCKVVNAEREMLDSACSGSITGFELLPIKFLTLLLSYQIEIAINFYLMQFSKEL